MKFCENGQEYSAVPEWVKYLIALGYSWERDRSPYKRRIGLISMPCESAAAGLIALGALRKDMERENANNYGGHFETLRRARDVYVQGDREGIVRGINEKKWIFSKKDLTGDSIKVQDADYRPTIKKGGKVQENPHGPCYMEITAENALNWHLDGEPIVKTVDGESALDCLTYKYLPCGNNEITEKNLKCSYGGLIIVGKASAKNTAYVDMIRSIKFGLNEVKKDLSELLTIFNMDKGSVVRSKLINYQNIESFGSECNLIIADGTLAIIRSIEHFKNSDVIGVFSRDERQENLEGLSAKWSGLDRYYSGGRNIECKEFSDIPLISAICRERK